MTQQQPDKQKDNIDDNSSKNFSEIAKGIFFLVSSISLIIVMLMFILVWQPIWTKGFNDFHTITNAINQLNTTAKPASETVPLMLEQMTEMNTSMKEMQVVMLDMHASMQVLEDITPQLEEMNTSIESMTMVLSTQMGQMSYIMEKMENRFSPNGMMPYNW